MSMYVCTYVLMLGRYVRVSVYQDMDGLMKVLLFNVDDLDAYKHTNKQTKKKKTNRYNTHSTYIHTYRQTDRDK